MGQHGCERNQTAVSFTAPSTVNWSGHGLSNAASGTPEAGNAVIFWAPSGSSLPAGISPSAYYYVVNSTANTFQLATAIGGTPISFAGAGSGTFYTFGLKCGVVDPVSKASAWDEMIAALNSAGMDILVDMSLVPASISVDGTQTNAPADSNFVNAWLNFLKINYNNPSKSVFYFECWNEPNSSGSFSGGYTGTGESGNNNLIKYTAYISNALTAVNFTGAQVVSPSFLWASGGASAVMAMQTWLSTTYNGKTAAQYCNIFAFHPYGIVGDCNLIGLASFVTMLNGINALNGTSTPIWVTEVGEAVATINRIKRAHLYAAALGVQRFFWYNYDEQTSVYFKLGMGGLQIAYPSTFYTYSPVVDYNPYPGLAAAYCAMITQFKGAALQYLNYAPNNYLVGTELGSSPYIF